MHCDILITHGMALPQPDQTSLLTAPAFLAIENGAIAALGPMDELSPAMKAETVIDATGSLIMPGLINGHSHAAMTLFRGLADDLPLLTWLNEHIFPAEGRFVNPEMVYWCTKLAAAEMLLSGTTTVADSYFFEDQAAQALHESGMRAVAAQGIIDFPAPGVPNPANNILAAKKYIETWQDKDSLVQAAVFCHSPYTCSPDTIKKAKKLATEKGVLFFIHLAETKTEIEMIRERFGTSPVKHLFNLVISHSLSNNALNIRQIKNSVFCMLVIWSFQKNISSKSMGSRNCINSNFLFITTKQSYHLTQCTFGIPHKTT